MATNEPKPAPTQAQITQRLVLRTAALLFVVAVLIFGFQWYRDRVKDMSAGQTADTVGMIGAIEYKKGGGQEAVLFKPDGTIVRNDGWREGVTDRDITWSPDGNFLFFISDRENNSFNVMRWSPGSNRVETRSIGTRGKSNPTFPVAGTPGKTALLTSGGVVFEYDPFDRSMRQVLPPSTREILQTAESEGGGQADLFAGSPYSAFGDSLAFRVARWFKGKDWAVGVIKRDNGEVLVAQRLTPNAKGEIESPVPITAGERVDFDVNPKTGGIVYATVGFQWPIARNAPKEFRVGNRITTPFRHVVGLFDPHDAGTLSVEDMKKLATEGANGPVIATQDDGSAFLSPKFSPDGTTILMVAGPYDVSSASVVPKLILSAPAKLGGAREAKPIVRGEVYEPSWSPDGNTIVFARRQNGHRTIFTVDRNGGSERNVSGDQGDFHNPTFSPQMK